jgi:chromosome segregation ATPase
MQIVGRVYAELASNRDLVASHATRMASKERRHRELATRMVEATSETATLRKENVELRKKLDRSTELVDEAVTTTERVVAENRELRQSVDSLEQQVGEISSKSKILENGNRSWAKKVIVVCCTELCWGTYRLLGQEPAETSGGTSGWSTAHIYSDC